MQIETRIFAKYINVEVSIENAYYDLGFHDIGEAKELRDHLKEVVDDLENYIQAN